MLVLIVVSCTVVHQLYALNLVIYIFLKNIFVYFLFLNRAVLLGVEYGVTYKAADYSVCSND